MPDEGGVGMALARKLNSLGAEVLLVEGVPDDDRLRQLLDSWLAEGGVDGVYWLPALDPVEPIAQLSGAEWTQAINQRVKLMHTAMQALFETYGEAGKFLVSATRMGGRHGRMPIVRSREVGDEVVVRRPLGEVVCEIVDVRNIEPD